MTFVTGTDTEVGKTIVTAAIAARLQARGARVAVYKPTQAGTSAGAGDIDVVRQLTGIRDVSEGIRLTQPMAPVAAAAQSGGHLPNIHQHVAVINHLASTFDRVLVEGSGGLLVQLDHEGSTLADLHQATTAAGEAVVVCRSGLGTLNHTALTLEALERRDVPVTGVVLGSWPTNPSEIELSNRSHLSAVGVPLLGGIPQGAGELLPSEFRDRAPTWLTSAEV